MDTLTILATVAALGLVCKGIVDWIRRNYPSLDGNMVQLIAVVIGVGMAAGLDIQATEALLEQIGAAAGRTPHVILDYIVTGVAIAFAAGALAEAVGLSGPKSNPAIIEVDALGKPL